jgi:hypothetical protein
MQVLNQIKETVKQHRSVPFNAREIVCDKVSNAPSISIHSNGERFNVAKPETIMSMIGIKPSLTKRILDNPSENWSAFQDAISKVDRNKGYNLIADNNNNVKNVVASHTRDIQQLNYDDRIDDLAAFLDATKDFEFQGAVFNGDNCSVDINVNNLAEEIDCGQGDLWKFGASINISLNNQAYSSYFLRLICTNGMTTRENIAYRAAEFTKNIAKQFSRYAMSPQNTREIVRRVDALKDARASVFELNSVAGALGKQADVYMPTYAQVASDFREAGYNIKEIPSQRAKMMFTNENLYDVFNTATYLASHTREEIGDSAALALNKAAGDMFTKGPNLKFRTVDIYAK